MFEKVGELLRDLGQSLRFDIQQSASLYILPIKALGIAYRQGVSQVSHRQPDASRIYDAAGSLLQQREEIHKVLAVYLTATGEQQIGPSISDQFALSAEHYIPATSLNAVIGKISQEPPKERLAA